MEIVRFMEQNDIQIAAIQETKLNTGVDVNVPNYTLVREDREKDKGGGLAFLVHTDIKFRSVSLCLPPSQSPILEQQAIAVTSKTSELVLINVYIYHQPHCVLTHTKQTLNICSPTTIALSWVI